MATLLREFYTAEDRTVKARPLKLVLDDRAVARPVDKLKVLLNPFLLDQNFLVNKSELDRKKYFAEMFNTSTEALDAEFAKANTEAAELRAKITGYGDIELTEVKRVDVQVLRTELSNIKALDRRARENWELRILQIRNFNDTRAANQKAVEEYQAEIGKIQDEIARLQLKEAEAKAEFFAGKEWLEANPVQVMPDSPEYNDTTTLEEQISQAAATNVRAEQYEANLARHKQKVADEKRVLELERRQRAIRDERIAKLDAIADASGIPGLEFLENGSFAYEDTQPGMLSTSQLMRLSAALSSKYPEGIGVDLIDRAESLGRSVFEFVDKAKAENKTILATIVGERPATVPKDVGVFVVEHGKVTA